MALPQPKSCYYSTYDKTSRLYFDSDSSYLTGSYLMRGAICFPKIIDFANGKVEGFILTAGQRVKDGDAKTSGCIYVFREQWFNTIDQMLGEGGNVISGGIVNHINQSWTQYSCNKYFYSQSNEVYKKHARAVKNAAMIQPKPKFVETPLMHEDMNEAMATVFEYLRAGKLVYTSGGGCHQAMDKLAMQDPSQTGYTPPAYALMCVVNGFVKYPYRERVNTGEPMIPQYKYEFEK